MEAIAIQSETMPVLRVKTQRDVSIDYLRTAMTVLVVLAHASAAYTRISHQIIPDGAYNMLFPIMDDDRHISVVCDAVLGFMDIFCMPLMFFISALFVYPSLKRHGAAQFLRGRLLRIGLPFVISVVLIQPISLFASYQLHYPEVSYLSFWLKLAHERFFSGPPWFLWVLLVFDFALATLFVLCNPLIQRLGPWLQSLKYKSASAAFILTMLSGTIYALLRFRYGYGYDPWHLLITPPFSLQPARAGIYIVWCMAGFLVGSVGLENGLLSVPGHLVKRWRSWIVLGMIGFVLLTFHYLNPSSPAVRFLSSRTLYPFAWTFAVSALCFASLALFRKKIRLHLLWMDSLTRCAYIIFLVHFDFVMWAQRLFLPIQISAVAKFLVTSTISLLLSWLTAVILLRIPGVRRVV